MNLTVLLLALAPAHSADCEIALALNTNAAAAKAPHKVPAPTCKCPDGCRCPGKVGGEACECGEQRRSAACNGCCCGCEDEHATSCQCGEAKKAPKTTAGAVADTPSTAGRFRLFRPAPRPQYQYQPQPYLRHDGGMGVYRQPVPQHQAQRQYYQAPAMPRQAAPCPGGG